MAEPGRVILLHHCSHRLGGIPGIAPQSEASRALPNLILYCPWRICARASINLDQP